MSRKAYATAVVALWLTALAAIYFHDQLTIARCLDAGGSFDYVRFRCDFAAAHVPTPYWRARLPAHLGVSAMLGVLSYLVAGTINRILSGRR